MSITTGQPTYTDLVFMTVAKRRTYLALRRGVELAVAISALPAVALVIAVCGCAVFLTMGAPIFFAQPRVGKNGTIFTLYKLRTMARRDNDGSSPTVANDPRVTPLGRFLRASHLDELPQIWNILIGDMSFIGPRPEQVNLTEQYCKSIDNFGLRLAVRPGLTGLAQVCSGYAATESESRVKLEYDLYYLANLSPALDLRILIKTAQLYLLPGTTEHLNH